MGILHLNGRTYSREEIVNKAFQADTELEKIVLPFCHAWLTGQPEFLLETSGSTGPPKSLLIRRNAMATSAALTQQALGLTANMHALVCLDTRFVAGRMMLVRGLETGMTLHVETPAANPFATLSPATRIDFAAFVPYQLEAILHSAHRHRFETMHVAIIGGAPLTETTISQLKPYSCKFFATYGMTETVSHIALQPLNGPNRKPWFQTLPGITFDTDARGCMVIHAPYLAEPVATNDIVRKISHAEFEWLGRWDHVINSGGIKIHPEVIEKKLAPVLASNNLNIRFFITASPHPRFYQQVTLVVELDDAAPVLRHSNAIRRALDRYELPQQIFCVARFIETRSGKVDRIATLRSNPEPIPFSQ